MERLDLPDTGLTDRRVAHGRLGREWLGVKRGRQRFLSARQSLFLGGTADDRHVATVAGGLLAGCGLYGFSGLGRAPLPPGQGGCRECKDQQWAQRQDGPHAQEGNESFLARDRV